jgi:RHS repeat-associated protein
MTRPNGVNTNYSYDSLSRLLSVLHQNGASTIDGASYTVDATGNRTSKTDQLAGVTSNYAYDPLYELTQVTQAANTTENYTYDPVGNRLSSLTAATSSYNSSNELTAMPSTAYTYDNNGNTASKTDSTGTTNYTWDYENRLVSVTLSGSGGTVNFKYDPSGRRIEKTSSSTTSIYAYDDANLIEETNAVGGATATYAQGHGVDEPLAMLRSGTTSYYDADGLSSVTSLTNGAGALAQAYTFDSFGKQTTSSGSLTNPFQYTGREFDSDSGLYYSRARYYDQNNGRFLSQDPILFAGGINFYAYVGNRPSQFNDPFGLVPRPAPLGLVVSIQNLFPGSILRPGATPSLIIPMSCKDATNKLLAQGYLNGEPNFGLSTSGGYNGPGSAYWNPINHPGGWEFRTGGPGFHFRMQYDRPDPFKACPDASCTLDQFHIDSTNPVDGSRLKHIACDFLHLCGFGSN